MPRRLRSPILVSLVLLATASCSDTADTPPGEGTSARPTSPPPLEESAFTPLFNGENLDGWESTDDLWSLRDGVIVGESPGIDHNTFLATSEEFADFELRLEFRLVGGEGNSGVQFRSQRPPGSPQVEGFQADIGPKYWGCLYDEARRDEMLAAAPKSLAEVLNPDGWNDYRIRAVGDEISLTLNGLETVSYRETDADIARTGIIALQVHSGPPMTIEFRNVRIARSPASTEG